MRYDSPTFSKVGAGLVTTDAQVRKLMEEFARHGTVGKAAIKAAMHRHTAASYLKVGRLPSQLRKSHNWRTRLDPFDPVDWAEVVQRLEDAPELEAQALFDDLIERRPGRYRPGHIRTFHRRVKHWRATEGPDKKLFFPQDHRPGEAAQTDFTDAAELGITIGGEAFPHLLCHFVLPFSNWEWATVAMSESTDALKLGVQAAVFRLGRVPIFHQTDNSTGATHRVGNADPGKRAFNDEYLKVMNHLGMQPRTTEVGEKEQNGDVEALNRSVKRRLNQHLLLRGSRDFESLEAYERCLEGVLNKANGLRREALCKELAVMRPLKVQRLPDYTEEEPRVSRGSTIRVKDRTYSVPSRLKNEYVRVRIYEGHLEVYYGGIYQFSVDRARGKEKGRISYRHIIVSLLRKPGAFARYRYREELFPTEVFRRAYDVLQEKQPGIKADVQYLRLLNLAATTMESEVQAAIELLMEEGEVPTIDAVRDCLSPRRPEIPEMAAYQVDLASYDQLLSPQEVYR